MQREIRVDGQRYFILSDSEMLLLQADSGTLRLAIREGEAVRFLGPEPGADAELTHAPWTADQVASLNGYQHCGYAHEFTGGNGETLIATPSGWVSQAGGPIVQTWAHNFMANGDWRKSPFYKGG